MELGRRDLLQRVQRFEETLRDAWDVDGMPLPRHLHSYREDWERTLAGPLAPASESELRRALAGDGPVLVADYHPLPRARRDLAATLSLLPPEQPLLLLLELLPRGVTMSARAALRDGRTRLASGPLLRDAYRPALEVLARRDGVIAGAWTESPAAQRDVAAVDLWSAAVRPGQRRRWVMHYGDWHLAEEHLPARLRAAGAEPICIHLSPEPIWRRSGLRARDHVQRLVDNPGHWVWLRTTPPGLWASRLTGEALAHGEDFVESVEHLVEGLSGAWCQALGLSDPELRLSIHGPGDWEGFRAQLPAAEAEILADAPLSPRFHPTKPSLWLPGEPGLNTLVEAAQHLQACASPLSQGGGAEMAVARQAWRTLGAALANPFLRAPRLAAAAESLFPAAIAARVLPAARAREEGLRTPGTGPRLPVLPPSGRVRTLLEWCWGARCGTVLAGWSELSVDFMQHFLRSGGTALESRILTATLRVA